MSMKKFEPKATAPRQDRSYIPAVTLPSPSLRKRGTYVGLLTLKPGIPNEKYETIRSCELILGVKLPSLDLPNYLKDS